MLDLQAHIPRKNMRKVFFTFLLLSLISHLSTLIHKIDLTENNKPAPLISKDKKTIKIRLIKEKKKQIVESREDDNLKNLNKIRDKFLSKKDNFFEKETVAKKVGKFRNSESSSTSVRKSESVRDMKKLSLENLALSDLSKFKVKKSKVKQKSNKLEKRQEKVSKVSQTNDYIDDVPIGELTQLNTTEFKFYGFYYRIKQRLEQHWGNSLREKASRLRRRKYSSSKDRITALVVILDSLGRIVKVNLKSTSGIEELDSAAIESFNKAGPFPNPPREMLQNGKAKIEWGFVVKT